MDEVDTPNYFEFLRLLSIKIEQMKKNTHVGILRIIAKDNETVINENKNGIHVNLSELNHGTIETICKYIEYIQLQEQNLDSIQAKQEDVKSFLL
jgi:hypothetical protein